MMRAWTDSCEGDCVAVLAGVDDVAALAAKVSRSGRVGCVGLAVGLTGSGRLSDKAEKLVAAEVGALTVPVFFNAALNVEAVSIGRVVKSAWILEVDATGFTVSALAVSSPRFAVSPTRCEAVRF